MLYSALIALLVSLLRLEASPRRHPIQAAAGHTTGQGMGRDAVQRVITSACHKFSMFESTVCCKMVLFIPSLPTPLISRHSIPLRADSRGRWNASWDDDGFEHRYYAELERAAILTRVQNRPSTRTDQVAADSAVSSRASYRAKQAAPARPTARAMLRTNAGAESKQHHESKRSSTSASSVDQRKLEWNNSFAASVNLLAGVPACPKSRPLEHPENYVYVT